MANHSRFIILNLIAFLLLLSQTATAQTVSIQASVDRTQLGPGDTLQLTITIQGQPQLDLQPNLPTLATFSIITQSAKAEVTYPTNSAFPQLKYQYQLQPTQTGPIIVGAASITVKGITYFSKPIPIQVIADDIQSGPQTVDTPSFENSDRYIEVSILPEKPYRGQQLIYTFRYIQAADIAAQVNYDPPSFSGFWVAATKNPERYAWQQASQTYQVSEIKTAIFPMQAGLQTIEAANAIIQSDTYTTLAGEQLAIAVQAWPPNPVDDFQGAVGQFTVEATIDKTEGMINDSFTLAVAVRGQGNIETLPAPVWPTFTEWRTLGGNTTRETQLNETDTVVGSSIFEQILIAEISGTLKIPPVRYAYFDPFQAQYRLIATEPITVQIAAPKQSIIIDYAPRQNLTEGGILATDIRHIKVAPTRLRLANQPLTTNRPYWLAWIIPFVVAGFYLGWLRWQPYMHLQHWMANRDRAYAQAVAAIAQARKGDDDKTYAAARILSGYLTHKFRRPIDGLTQATIVQHLATAGLTDDLINQTTALLNQFNVSRYAPSLKDRSDDDPLQTIAALIRDIENPKLSPTLISVPAETIQTPVEADQIKASNGETSVVQSPGQEAIYVNIQAEAGEALLKETIEPRPEADKPPGDTKQITHHDAEIYQEITALIANKAYTEARLQLMAAFLASGKHTYRDVAQLYAYVATQEALMGQSPLYQKYALLLDKGVLTTLSLLIVVCFLLGLAMGPLFSATILRFVFIGGLIFLWGSIFVLFYLHKRGNR